MKGWIGVDLDGTLAYYTGWQGEDHIGEPIPKMVEFVKRLLLEGNEVRIFTARASAVGRTLERRAENINLIQDWCERNIGQILTVTSDKDFGMIALYDDRAFHIRENEGYLVEDILQETIDALKKDMLKLTSIPLRTLSIQEAIDGSKDSTAEKA